MKSFKTAAEEMLAYGIVLESAKSTEYWSQIELRKTSIKTPNNNRFSGVAAQKRAARKLRNKRRGKK